LSKSDYYAEKGEIIGHWGGRGAVMLGLYSDVTREAFHSLCHNITPQTSDRLTARNDANRTTGYDWTFSVPKSVSIIHSQTNDRDILTALNIAVHYAMSEAEKDAETRVRKNGESENRTTQNLTWATFTHTDARPVDGIPDPHLHTHCFVFNATHDPAENQWKAGQFRNLKAEAPYYEALFHNKLAYELQNAGYEIERNERDFEIAGFGRTTIEKFSRRTLEVNEKIEALGLEYAEDKGGINVNICGGS
jgi:conjugative relaxase-like TrwC/TraI family protein